MRCKEEIEEAKSNSNQAKHSIILIIRLRKHEVWHSDFCRITWLPCCLITLLICSTYHFIKKKRYFLSLMTIYASYRIAQTNLSNQLSTTAAHPGLAEGKDQYYPHLCPTPSCKANAHNQAEVVFIPESSSLSLFFPSFQSQFFAQLLQFLTINSSQLSKQQTMAAQYWSDLSGQTQAIINGLDELNNTRQVRKSPFLFFPCELLRRYSEPDK